MSRQNLKYNLILFATIALVIAVEVLSPKPIDWTATFSQYDKNPYGSYILFERLPDIFPGRPVKSVNITLYERNQSDSLPAGNYLFFNSSFSPGEADVNVLLDLVSQGSQAFIAAEFFDKALADTLLFRTENQLNIKDSLGINFTHPALRAQKLYQYKHVYGGYTFAPRKDTVTSYEILGVNQFDKPTFIRVPFGKGNFYLNTLPLAYTNYNMLYRQNADYIAKSLSYLPVQVTYWNEYYNEYRTESQSPFRFFLSQPPLRWALYVSIIAVLLFIFFEAKRKQRIIPIVKPLTNSTLEFTETVGQLYYQYKDHKNIAEKRITYFLDYLRTRFYMRTATIDEAFYIQLAEKSGVPKEEIMELFRLINQIHSRTTIAEEDLLKLNAKIEYFKMKTGVLN